MKFTSNLWMVLLYNITQAGRGAGVVNAGDDLVQVEGRYREGDSGI